MKELILASENKNKIKETQEIFTEYKIIPISEFKNKMPKKRLKQLQNS